MCHKDTGHHPPYFNSSMVRDCLSKKCGCSWSSNARGIKPLFILTMGQTSTATSAAGLKHNVIETEVEMQRAQQLLQASCVGTASQHDHQCPMPLYAFFLRPSRQLVDMQGTGYSVLLDVTARQKKDAAWNIWFSLALIGLLLTARLLQHLTLTHYISRSTKLKNCFGTH